MEPSVGERRQLMPPRIPAFRKTVAQQHQGALSRLGDVETEPVSGDHPMTYFALRAVGVGGG
jgi:hypothetical protein